VGAARPDIATLDGFKATLVRANAIAFPPQAQPGRTRICSRAQGCPKRCAQSSSSCPTKFLPTPCPTVRRTIPYVPQFGAELLGPLPAEVQIRIGFAAARGSSATEVQAAEALLAYLHTPEAVAVLKAKGFEPK
jgi:molybdate transport system substrate-binding protein